MTPELSIVTVSRNDNHGGDLDKRTQLFIEGIYTQSARFQFPVELILVEWNPPAEADSLAKSITWPPPHPYCSVRVIVVPNEIHRKYRYSDSLPLYQMIGKNVGIRRATAQFILSTNIDILFSDELFEFFSQRMLRKNIMYRVDRIDIDNSISLNSTHDERLQYCELNKIRVNEKFQTYELATRESRKIHHMAEFHDEIVFPPPLHTNACGDFQLMDQDSWHSLRGYPELDLFSMHIDSVFQHICYQAGKKEELLPYSVYHIEHTSGWSPEGEESLNQRLMEKRIDSLSYEQLYHIAHEMELQNKALIFNNKYWGLSSNSLKEAVSTGGQFKVFEESQEFFKHLWKSCDTEGWLEKIDYWRDNALSIDGSDFNEVLHRRAVFILPSGGCGISEGLHEMVSAESKRIVLFGAGSAYDQFTKKIVSLSGTAPSYFVDNNPRKINSMKDGIPIKPVEVLRLENKDNLLIIVSSQFYEEIRDQLIKLGFIEYVHFLSGVITQFLIPRRR